MDSTANGTAASSGAQTPAEANVAWRRASFWALTLGSVGVVYGDIGTSPLYAFREAVNVAQSGGPVTREIVLGVLSMILWSLIVVVTLKYIVLLLRMDNNGEGGTLSLTALAFRAVGRRAPYVLILGVIGAAMFYGSSLITPALSVLSAVEGLKLWTPAFEPYVLPITIVLLIGLFAVQSRGTGRVAVLFGPIMVAWFVAMTICGALHIADDPGVLAAINPYYAIKFLVEQRRARPDHARRGLPGRHRQRGALCRSRAFRPQADPDRMVLSRVSGAADQLFRSGRARSRRSGDDGESVLSSRARYAVAADGRAWRRSPRSSRARR